MLASRHLIQHAIRPPHLCLLWVQAQKRPRSGLDTASARPATVRSALAAMLAPFHKRRQESVHQHRAEQSRPAMLAHVLSFSAQQERQPSTAGR